MPTLKTENYLIRYDIMIDGVTIRDAKLVGAPGSNAAKYRLASHFFSQGIPCRVVNCQSRVAHQHLHQDITWMPPQVDAANLDA